VATVARSTVSGNSAADEGGGIGHWGSSLLVTQSTVSGNTARRGGGIYYHYDDITIDGSTVTGNAATDGGGLYIASASAKAKNTIVAGNTSTGTGPDVHGSFTSLGHNLIGDGSGSAGSTNGVSSDWVGTAASPFDPQLGPLQDNGGPTWTHLPRPGSPAIDAGDNSGTPATDQIGNPRLQDGDGDGTATVDIGAVELFLAEVRGAAFHDLNENGVRDADEPALSGWKVFVDGNGNGTPDVGEPFALTDVDGNYILADVHPGLSYSIREELPTGWRCVAPSGGSFAVTPRLGEAVTGRDFANRALPGEIRGQVFHDLDYDGAKDVLPVAFSDEFDAGASPLWGNEVGNWTVVNGHYYAAQSSVRAYSSLPYVMRDFTVQVDITDFTIGGGLWLRSTDDRNGVLLIMGGDTDAGTGLYWHTVSDGVFSPPLNVASGLFQPGVSDPHLRVTVCGDTYAVYVDGSPTPATTLTTAAFTSGRVALYSWYVQKYDRVSVTGDMAEPGLAGWTIYLDANGNVQLDTGEISTTTAADGYYAFAGLEPLRNYTVAEVVADGWERTFPTQNAGRYAFYLDAGETAVNKDFGNGLTLAVDDVTVDPEGDAGTTNAAFVVRLSAASGVTTTVQYSTGGGGATPDVDYRPMAGALIFAPGETIKTIAVPVYGDLTDEWDQRFFLNLINATNARIVRDWGMATIVDDDAPATLTIGDATLPAEGDSGTQDLELVVTLSAASEKPIDVDFATADGTAIAGSDYTAASGTLHFAPGETTQKVCVTVRGEMEYEPNETFTVQLSHPVNATLANDQAVGTISNDDPLLAVNSTLDKPDLTPGDFVVNTGTANEITLRAAIMEANALAGPDIITLPAGTYTLTLSGRDEDQARTGDLDIAAGALTIVGAGADRTVIDASGLDRVFHVLAGATLNLSGVTLRGGNTINATLGGAGVLNTGTLTVTDCVLEGNQAVAAGGAIENRAVASLTRTTVRNNAAASAGAFQNAAGATATIVDATFRDNRATAQSGGAIGNSGTGSVEVWRTLFSHNTAQTDGGAISSTGTVTLYDSTFDANAAGRDGGASFSSITAADRPVQITGATFVGNTAIGRGGALFAQGNSSALTVTNSTFTLNQGQNGGAAYVLAGTLTLTNTTVARNSATDSGGGLFNAATTSLRNTLVAANTATAGDPDLSGAFTTLGCNLVGNLGAAGGLVHGTSGDLVGSAVAPLDARLGALGEFGGPTQTIELLPDSPAVDAGTSAGAPLTDQRGFLRPEDGNLDDTAVFDIGAFELAHNLAPQIVADTFTLDEDAAVGTVVGIVQASGPEPSDSLTITVESGNTGDAFAFDPLTRRLTLAKPLDYEALATYHLTVRAIDQGHRSATATITVDVHDVNERPYGIGSGIDDRVRPDGTPPETIDLTNVFADPDRNTTLSFTTSSSNPQLVQATIDAGQSLRLTYAVYASGQNRTPAVVTVTARDSDGLEAQDSFTVTVTPTATFEYHLVIVAQPTPQPEVTTLPTSLTSVSQDAQFYAEVWVRDLFVPGLTSLPESVRSVGVQQAAVNVRYDALLAEVCDLAQSGGIFDDFGTYSGTVDAPAGVVRDFGAAAQNAEHGVTPAYGRLGVIELRALATGQEALALHLDAPVDPTVRALADGAMDTIDPSQIRLSQAVTVTIVPAGGTVPFAPAIDVPLGLTPTSLAAADFDGDGDPDVAVGGGSVGKVSVLHNTPGLSYTVTLGPGQVATGLNFGNRPARGEIRGQVFNDLNENGVRDLIERGLKDFTVFLDLNRNGAWDADEPKQQTNENGEYAFVNVPGLREYVVVQEAMEGASPTHSRQQTAPVAPGQTVAGLDFGNKLVGGLFGTTISGFHFRDTNGNGARDPGEPGLPGCTVYIDLDGDGQPDAEEPSVTTGTDNSSTPDVDETGWYEFPSLGPGNYELRIVEPVGLRQTYPLGNVLTPAEYHAGDGPRSIAVADFTGDALPDLAVANAITNNVSVLRNLGQGVFAPAVNMAVGLGATSVTAADLDGDQDPDLAVANAYHSSVSVLLNQGDGTFAAARNFPAGIGPSAVTSGDFNRDGFVDLAVANEFSNNISVLWNDGLGYGSGSSPRRSNFAADDSPVALVAADLNQDGWADLVAVNIDSDDVSLLINDQRGGFVKTNLPVGDAPFAMVAADFDGDGRPDLAAANVLSDNIAVLRNTGSGFAVPVYFAAGKGPLALAAADLDADGDMDLAVTGGSGSSHLSLLRNDGTGQFGAPVETGVANFPTLQPFSVAAADLDRNGSADLAVANGESDNVSVLANTLVPGAHTIVLKADTPAANVNFGSQPCTIPPTITAMADVATDEDTPTQALGFTVRDVETAATALVVTAASSDPAVVPNANLVLGGGGANRTLTVTPAANQSGTATITVTVADAEGGTAASTFTITVRPVNDAPTISAMADVATDEDTPTESLGFMVGDVETAATGLVVTASSSDSAVAPNGNLVLGGGGANRTLTVTPGTNQSGTATITVVVADAEGATATGTFTVTVRPVNDPPTLAPLSGLALEENAPQQAVSLTGITAGGGESQPLGVAATSNSPDLLPDLSVQYSSPQADGTLTFTPAPNRSGVAYVTVTVTDGGLDGRLDTEGDNASLAQKFTVIVNAVNPPTLDAIGNPPRVNQDAGEQSVGLSGITTGGQADAELAVTASTDNTALITALRVAYTAPAETATVFYTPSPGQSGTAQITVTVTHGGTDRRLATPEDNKSFSRSFTVTVNGAPTDIVLTAAPIAENSAGAVVGSVVVHDPDVSDTHSFFISDARFEIAGGQLRLRADQALDREAGATVPVRITATDPGGLSVSRDFALMVLDVNERPQIVQPIPDQQAVENIALLFTVPAETFVDPDAGDHVTYAAQLSAGGELPGWLQFDAATCTFSGTPPFGAAGPLTLQVTARDRDGLEAIAAFRLTVSVNSCPWQNPVNALDVDADGRVIPLDVLLTINYINVYGIGRPPVLPSPHGSVRYFDVSGDNVVSPVDVLRVINYINARSAGGGEGEAAGGLANSRDAFPALGRGLPTPAQGSSARPRAELPSWDDALDVLAEDVARAYAALESSRRWDGLWDIA
jgi:predicted outer membrane repeat protein